MRTRLSLNTTTTQKLAKIAVGFVAVFALMGADGDGCSGGGTPPDPGPDPEPTECPPDHYLEVVCDGHDPNCPEGDPGHPGDCYEICVPIDDPCGPGMYEDWICEEIYPPGICLSPEGCDPEPIVECYPICVPDEDPCGPGYHEEWICEDHPDPWDPGMGGGDPGHSTVTVGAGGAYPDPGMTSGVGGSPGGPPYPGTGAGGDPGMTTTGTGGWGTSSSVTTGGGGDPGMTTTGSGWGTGSTTTGGGWGSSSVTTGGGGGHPGPECYPICVPDHEECPPGLYPQTNCDEDGCWTECLPY